MAYDNIHMIINPAAGQAHPILHTVNKVFHAHKIAWDVSITQHDRPGAQLARRAVEAGADLVVVYGGDGTVQDVVNGLVGHDVPLAILHGGTGNAMAHELGIPRDLAQAAELIAGEHALRGVDVGEVTPLDDPDNGRYFMLRASIGLQTEILESATREFKDRFGNLAYVMASLHSLADSEPRTYHLTIDGEDVSGAGLTCMITNSASVGGRNSFLFASDVDPCDGLLDVFVLDTSFEALISALSSALDTEAAPYNQHWTGRDISVQAETQQVVTLDGEPFTETPVRVTVLPQALRVVVPAE